MAFTATAEAVYPFSWTIPDINSTQYPLMPLTDLYSGFLTCVLILITWLAVIEFRENVIVDKSDEI